VRRLLHRRGRLAPSSTRMSTSNNCGAIQMVQKRRLAYDRAPPHDGAMLKARLQKPVLTYLAHRPLVRGGWAINEATVAAAFICWWVCGVLLRAYGSGRMTWAASARGGGWAGHDHPRLHPQVRFQLPVWSMTDILLTFFLSWSTWGFSACWHSGGAGRSKWYLAAYAGRGPWRGGHQKGLAARVLSGGIGAARSY